MLMVRISNSALVAYRATKLTKHFSQQSVANGNSWLAMTENAV